MIDYDGTMYEMETGGEDYWHGIYYTGDYFAYINLQGADYPITTLEFEDKGESYLVSHNWAQNYLVPKTRKINNKPLSSDITLTASDVGALPSSTSIPSKTSDLTNDSGFVQSSSLASVATSGSYNDLSNKPTIPDVSNLATKAEVANKQDTISDLATIRTGAGKGATAIQGIIVGGSEVTPDANRKVTIPAGADGKSAYQSYLDTTSDNPKMSEAEWVASLKGEKGDAGNVHVTDGVADIDIINDLSTGGVGDALSAEMGLLLKSNIIIVQSNIERLYNKLANMAFWNATDQAAAQPRNLNFHDLQATLTFDLTAVGSGVVVKLNNNSFTNPVSVDTDSTNIITIQAVEDWLLNNDVAIEIGGVSQTLAESGGVYSLEFVASTNLSIAITATATQEWFTLNKDDVSENGDVVRYGMQRGKSMNGTYGYLTGGSISSSDHRPAVICAPAGYPYSTKIIDPVPTDRTGNTNPGKTTASYIATGGKRYLHVKLADSGTTSGYIHKVAVPCYDDAVIGNTQADSSLNATNISGNKGRINYVAPNNGSMQWKIDLSAQAAGITYIKLLLAKYPESTPNAAIYTEDWYSDMTVKYKFTDA